MVRHTTFFDWLKPNAAAKQNVGEESLTKRVEVVKEKGREGTFANSLNGDSENCARISTQSTELQSGVPKKAESDALRFSECSSFESMRDRVIQTMLEINIAKAKEIEALRQVPLNRLRRDATRLHAVCRFRRKAGIGRPLSTTDVREIALHPVAFEQRWSRYAHFLLYHEFLHGLGNIGHDRHFRYLESLWPDERAKGMGKEFGRHLRARQKRWLWSCNNCGKQHPRSRKSNGRYLCRKCGTRLEDVSVERQAP